MSRVNPLIRAVGVSALSALTVCALAAEPLVEFREARGCRMRGSAQSVERMKEIASQGSVTWDGACRNGWIDGPGVLRHEGRVLDNGRMRRYAFFFTGVADNGVRRGQWRRESMNMFEDSSRYWTALAVIAYTDGVSRGSPRNVVVRSDAEFGAPFRAMLATVDRELAQRAAAPAAEAKVAEVAPAPAAPAATTPPLAPAPVAAPAPASPAPVPPATPAPAVAPAAAIAPATVAAPATAAPASAAAPMPPAAPAPTASANTPAVSAAPAAPPATVVTPAPAVAPTPPPAPVARPAQAAPAVKNAPSSPPASVRSAPAPAPEINAPRNDAPPTGPSLAMGRPSSGSGLRLPQGMAAPPRERVALEQTHGCSVDTVNGTAASQGSVAAPRKGVLRVTGWAGDPRSNTLPPRAWIQISSVATAEAVRIPMVRTVDRPDAAKAMGHAIFARSGFDQNLDVDTFPPGQYLVAIIQQVDNEFLICSSVAEVSLR